MRQARKSTLHPIADNGYTLVELLVVLAILGLLAAMAAPQMERYFEHGQDSAAKAQIANLSAALHLYRSDVGRYPTAQEGLGALLEAPPGAENWAGPYVKKPSALNDPWGRRFIYRSPGRSADFDLFSLGPGRPAPARPARSDAHD